VNFFIQVRPNTNSASSSAQQSDMTRSAQPSTYFLSTVPRQQYVCHPSSNSTINMSNSTSSSSVSSTSSTTINPYQVPMLPPPPAPTITRTPNISSPSTVNIVHKNLPFYRSLACVYECTQVFRYDSYRKQYVSRHDFLLTLDVCNQLALSYDYEPDLDIHRTSKCLILRLVRIDQPPMSNGKYDDSLPPNLVIHINSQNLTNLPIPKPCTRQQTDIIRIGREIDITSYCMFNPTLSNELSITWSYRPDNANLHAQYATAQYALHIFLVQHLTLDDLCEQIQTKQARFYREDLVKFLAKARATDHDLGLEVSDQRRLRIPIRAVTCQHLQCFDLTNYIGKRIKIFLLFFFFFYRVVEIHRSFCRLALNEKAGKWMCPVCNKSALFDDLQIDSYTQLILNSIDNENITEITIDSDLHWKPIIPSSINEYKQQRQAASHTHDIMNQVILKAIYR
jgi:hypothetical protein